jgi:hypothetical protein
MFARKFNPSFAINWFAPFATGNNHFKLKDCHFNFIN